MGGGSNLSEMNKSTRERMSNIEKLRTHGDFTGNKEAQNTVKAFRQDLQNVVDVVNNPVSQEAIVKAAQDEGMEITFDDLKILSEGGDIQNRHQLLITAGKLQELAKRSYQPDSFGQRFFPEKIGESEDKLPEGLDGLTISWLAKSYENLALADQFYDQLGTNDLKAAQEKFDNQEEVSLLLGPNYNEHTLDELRAIDKEKEKDSKKPLQVKIFDFFAGLPADNRPNVGSNFIVSEFPQYTRKNLGAGWSYTQEAAELLNYNDLYMGREGANPKEVKYGALLKTDDVDDNNQIIEEK